MDFIDKISKRRFRIIWNLTLQGGNLYEIKNAKQVYLQSLSSYECEKIEKENQLLDPNILEETYGATDRARRAGKTEGQPETKGGVVRVTRPGHELETGPRKTTKTNKNRPWEKK